MEDFLPLFKQNKLAKNKPMRGKREDIFFTIGINAKGAYILTTNAKGEYVSPDYRLYSGGIMTVLRMVDEIKGQQEMHISWDVESDEAIYLQEHPYLLYELLMCDNLRDTEGQKITVSKDSALLEMRLEEVGKDSILTTAYAVAGDKATTDFHFLSDSFILMQNGIYPVKPVGGNYTMLSVFNSKFKTALTERFLSVFLSYINNVSPVYADYEVVFSESSVEAVPTVIFEKVDSDQALYIQLRQMVPGIDIEFFNRFELLYVVTLTMDRKMEVKPIKYNVEEDAEETLYKSIVKFAPNKTDKKNVYHDDGLFIIPAEVAGPFLLQSLPVLISKYQLLGAEKLKEYKIAAVRPKLNVKFGSGIDFLDGEASVEVGDEQFKLADFLRQYNKNKYIALNDGNRAIIDSDYVKRLGRLFKKGKKKGEIKVSFFDLPEVEDLMQQRLEGEAFKRHREIFEGFNKIHSSRINVKKVNATLRPYQQEGVKWIDYLYRNDLGGCLADDMGLGKTLQAITMLTLLYPKEKQPTLIVMPRSLLFNWQSELQRFAPQLTVYTYYGTTRDISEALKHQLILTTYALVRNDIETFSKQSFNMVILDESQNIKNVSAQTTQSIYLLQTKHRLALSGTPVENNLTELYSLFRFLNPAMFGSIEEFNSAYTTPIQKDNDKDAMRVLRSKISPFMLRRLKKDVLKDLPDKIEQTLYVDMSDEQANYYEQRRRFFYEQVKTTIAAEGIAKSQFVMFQALNELRRIASVPESLSDGRIQSPKLDMLIDTLCDAVSNGHKAVVFFNYIAGIELVGNLLDERGIDYVSMTGSTHDRKSLVERFQNDAKCKVFLMTLKTGGVGLNLVAADVVFIFEPWWNKAAEEQAVNRLYRIGQKKNVLSYSMITRNTIEEKILLLQQQKAELLEGLISSDSSSIKQLSEEDIQFILG